MRKKLAIAFGVAVLVVMQSAQAALIAYEPFATGNGGYTTGNIDGQNPSVTGFSGQWTHSQYNNANISATGLSYPGIPTTGGMYVGDNSRSYRALATPFGSTTSGTYWMSYLYQSTADGGNWQAFETYTTSGTIGQDSSRRYLISNGAAGWDGGTGTGAFNVGASGVSGIIPGGAAGTDVNLFVIKMEFVAGGNDTFTVWRNPSLGSEPTTGGLAKTGDFDWAYTGIFDADTPGKVNFDEIRIGTTFVDVIPEPGSLSLLGLMGGALFLRRKLRKS